MHKSIGFLFVFYALVCCSARGQNLVVNPGFERYNKCPSARGDINASVDYSTFETVTDWVNPQSTSPDYLNRCGTDSTVRLPYLSDDGYHQPRSGNGCAGVFMFSGNPGNDTTDYWSEYLETKLSAPLIAGHTYYISYYVCLTWHIPGHYNTISVDQIGARLTENQLDSFPRGPVYYLTGPAAIQTPPGQFVTDTANWTLISGIYQAQGGEQWLTIGRFYNDLVNPDTISSILLLHAAPDPVYAGISACYMLVDDVCTIDMNYPVGTDTMVYTPQFPVYIGEGRPPGKYLWNGDDTAEQKEVYAPGTYLRQRWSECGYYIDTFTIGDMAVQNCIWMPTAFTPNGDGRNDNFGPGNSYCQPDFQNFSFNIYNRWGQRVFQTFSAGDKWDGRYNGKAADAGTYFYVLEYSYGGGFSSLNPNAAPVMIKGDVTLIR